MTHAAHNRSEEMPEGEVEALFPIFLKLAGRRVLLVGGGVVAAQKHAALMAAGASITVVAPEIGPRLRQPGTILIERGFEPSDLDGVWLVVAAAPPEVNRQVQAAAEARQLFVNAVDDPRAASAYAAAVIRRGALTVAVSTTGTAPALAGLLREALEALLPDEHEFALWRDVAARARTAWKKAQVPMTGRRPLLLEALNGIYERLNDRNLLKKRIDQ